MNLNEITAFIKSEALKLGFMSVGISKATFLEEEAKRLEDWLNKGMQGEMKYMENYFDKRLDPRLLVDDAKSVISLLLNYYPEKELPESGFKISKYAYGTDYHFVIKDKLSKLVELIQEKRGDFGFRAFVDSAPVMDKVWAKKSGLGWIGKNSNLISKENGSFFFIAELIVDFELNYDTEIKDYCGTCTACIDACPTNAIVEPNVVNGSKCISYYTIELKESIENKTHKSWDKWIFGCDVCQDVCPWNSFSMPHSEPLFNPSQKLLNFKKSDWEELSKEVFNEVFKNSPLKRTGFERLKKNLTYIKPGF